MTHTTQTSAAQTSAAPAPAPAPVPAAAPQGPLARIVVNRLVRPVWYALVAYGGFWLPGGSQYYGDALRYAAGPGPGPDENPRGQHLRSS
ncbi:hypothetical protein [Streptomyces sp. NPDC057302]|uniref:hypothetical protein n=1 Tax=Streptomyces sp. NPDC057302 TaxID=3346094 RepID=UPI00363C85B2